MKTIKIADGVRVAVDGETTDFPGFGVNEACEYLNIPKDAVIEITKSLFCFHYIDLSPAYPGHKITVELIPAK